MWVLGIARCGGLQMTQAGHLRPQHSGPGSSLREKGKAASRATPVEEAYGVVHCSEHLSLFQG